MASKVFDIVELREEILLFLPNKDLLFAQNGCKAWEHAVEESVKIQKALFFQPATEMEAKRLISTPYHKAGLALNPLLVTFDEGEDEDEDHLFIPQALDSDLESSCRRMYISHPVAKVSGRLKMPGRDYSWVMSRSARSEGFGDLVEWFGGQKQYIGGMKYRCLVDTWTALL